MILSVDGDEDRGKIREFVDNYLLAKDSRVFRNYIRETQPDVNLNVIIDTSNGEENVDIPIGITFFWPDANL